MKLFFDLAIDAEDIVNIADAFDRNLGFYPHPLSDPLLKEFAAIFATYFDIRAELPYVSPRLWAATIEAVFLRFDLFEAGRLEVEQTLCTDYVNVKELYPDLPDPQGFVFFSKDSPFTRTSLFEQKYSDYAYLLGADGKSFR